MKILITGTPGTGKSSVAKEICSRKGWPLLSLKEIAGKHGCIIGKEGGERIVDVRKLRAATIRELKGKKNAVVEGHLGCEFRLPVKFVFVLRTHPDELKERMRKRKYPKMKIEENLMAEMLDYCSQVSAAHYRVPILEVDTTKRTAKEAAGRIISFLEGRVKNLDSIDWGPELRKKTLRNIRISSL
ncbi:MAG: adenylate kinase family protein [Candidatus Micrarchaeia archaeon]|jgi:adenylate kinase